MARVIATGGTPPPGASTLGQGFDVFGQRMLQLAELLEGRRQRDLEERVLGPVSQAIAQRMLGGQQQQAPGVEFTGGQTAAASPNMQAAEARLGQGTRTGLAGLTVEELAQFLTMHPDLMKDPERLTQLILGETAAPPQFQTVGKGDTLFKIDPATGKAVEVAQGAAEPETVSRVVSGNSPLNEAFSLGIPAGEHARVAFTKDPATGQLVSGSVEGRFGAGTNIEMNVPAGEDSFQKQFGKNLADQLDVAMADAKLAGELEQSLGQMSELLSGGVETGSLQPAITSLQGIAADLNIDLAALATGLNIDVGSLRNKQEFHRLATRVIIEGFEKFKGNLNQREVELAEGAFANLGRSEGANIDAVASGLAAMQIIRERGAAATNVNTRRGALELTRAHLNEDTSRFNTLRTQFKDQIEEQFRAAKEAAAVTEAPAFASAAEVMSADIGVVRAYVEGLDEAAFAKLPPDVVQALQQKLEGAAP